MRATAFLVLFACSNAADPSIDAARVDATSDGHALDAGADGPTALRILVVNEVAAGETIDWFEIVNATTSPVQLADFVFVDAAGDFAKAVAFPATVLGPGAYTSQDCDGTVVPFKLASDEELWVYRASDHALSDGVDWADGDSPTGGSYARMPDIFGPFQKTNTQTRAAHN